MRIGLGSATITDAHATLEDIIEEVISAERDGYATITLPNIFNMDALTVSALAGQRTSRIEITTGVVPTPPRHPVAMAQQALTVQAACGGRFTLGIGLSHKIVIESMFGLSYDAPAKQMREYLDVLMPILRGEAVAHAGDLFNVNATFKVEGGAPVPVMVAALGPRMLKVAGELADGTTTWMTGLKTLGDHTVPSICAAAEAAGRPAPRILAAIPIALTNDVDAARAACSESFAMYNTLPSYRAMLEREGAAEPGGVALLGDEAGLRAGLQRFRDAGVTDFVASVFPADAGAIERTREFLNGEV